MLIQQITFITEVIPHTLNNLSALLVSRYGAAVGKLRPAVSKPNDTYYEIYMQEDTI
jgi:hypothetical protein